MRGETEPRPVETEDSEPPYSFLDEETFCLFKEDVLLFLLLKLVLYPF